MSRRKEQWKSSSAADLVKGSVQGIVEEELHPILSNVLAEARGVRLRIS
jgi:hypothetical protein